MGKCPRCLKDNGALGALSRRDNKTMICNSCGTEEAMIDAGLIKEDFMLGVDKIFVESLLDMQELGRNYEKNLSRNDEKKFEKYISGEECVNCGLDQGHCKCSDKELEEATEKFN